MKPLRLALAAAAAGLVLAAPGAAHDLDHDAPAFAPAAPPSPAFVSGGAGATWDLLATLASGNPHTDLDFFTQGGETYASVGTLAAGPNGAGQTIVQLTEGGEVTADSVRYVSSQASAECPSNPLDALGLQHDVEATPKGDVPLNADYGFLPRRDTQLLVDASDAPGRCHDGGALPVLGAVPPGGLEIVDITDVQNPFELALTSHIGEAHTVNIDPRRPHIAYAVTSDAVSLNPDGSRQNENPADSDRFDLDGFEVVDLSSCLDFAPGTSPSDKRAACRPQVYRYRFPTAAMATGHTTRDALYGCHELELHPNDILTCGSGAALVVLDMSGAFDAHGKPKGTPLPCAVRASTSLAPFSTGAKVTDCVVGQGGADLSVSGWLALGAPSLEGVRYVGSVHHQGRGGPYPSAEDNDFDHEAELSSSGKFLIATDERGGGVAPPGSTCATGVENPVGNGGLHAYRTDRLDTDGPSTAEAAWEAYARTPAGAKAVYRATPRTGPEATVCTAHVFQQIPGQNRIFMGWYSQGTQVVDYVEHPDGSFEFHEAGWFIPAKANTWTSAVFKVRANADGTFTYWGATGDFNLGGWGRSAMDVYRVTLPAPRTAAVPPAGGGSTGGGGSGGGGSTTTPPPAPGGPATTTQPGTPATQPGAVAGAAKTQKAARRYVRVLGRTATALVQINLSKGPRGKVRYWEPQRQFRFHSLSVKSVAFSGKVATIKGAGLLNGRFHVRFTAQVTDRGRGRLDVVMLKLSNGMTRSSPFVRGNATVR